MYLLTWLDAPNAYTFNAFIMIQSFSKHVIQAFGLGIIILLWCNDDKGRSVKTSAFYDQPVAAIFNPVSVNEIFSDTINRPKIELVEKKFYQLKLLSSPSAYELFYQANPRLRDNKDIEEAVIRTPKMPALMDQELNDFYTQFQRDNRKDEKLQAVLKDSIRYCLDLFEDLMWSGDLRFSKEEDRYKVMNLGFSMYDDLDKLINKDVPRVKAIELIKLLNGCSIVFQKGKQGNLMTPEYVSTIYYIGKQVSYILNSENMRKYFSESEKEGKIPESPYSGHGPFEGHAVDMGTSSTFEIGELKPFSVAIYLSKNGQVISDGPEVKKRYRVICYPPALIGFEPTRRDCDSPATFAYITLSKAPYAFSVVDLRTGKKMKFVKDSKENEIINTETAFNTMSNGMLDLPSLFQIALYIKED